MGGAHVVSKQRSTYGRRGHEVSVEEAFMQFDVSFMRDGSLGQLKGARLSAFIAAGLHEAEILLGDADPFTLRDFIARTRWSKPSMIDALDYLVEHHFLVELPDRGENREKQYRVAAYMWFGKSRRPAAFSAPGSSGSKGQNSLPLGESKKFSLGVGVDQPSFSEGEIQHQGTTNGETRKIFAAVHIGGESLRLLSQTVAPELATRWARWIGWASEHARCDYSNPAGLAIYRLGQDPRDEPPDDIAEESDEPPQVDRDTPIKTPFAMQVDDHGASDLWHATLGELQLQMTRATFDTWVRPTRAIQRDGDTLIVGVHSPYAKEWLENRLNTTIQRTVTGILGRSVQVRYVVRDSNPAEVQDGERATD